MIMAAVCVIMAEVWVIMAQNAYGPTAVLGGGVFF